MRGVRAAAALAIAVLAWPPAAAAHEIGTTQVVATFKGDGTYQIDIRGDPEVWLARLEALSGTQRSGPLPPEELQKRIVALQFRFLDVTRLAFDSRRVEPRVAYLPPAASDLSEPASVPGTSQPATIRLTGDVPEGARTFLWSYSLTYTTYAFSIKHERDERPVTLWLEGGAESAPFDLRRETTTTRTQVALRYLALGFTHILPKGLDHILFVLGIFLLSRRMRPILLQVTAFTVAHSITLGLTIYGVVSLAPSIVEPLIALSISYVAIENLFTSDLKPWRIALVFGFGLLHGMGFAGVLGGLGLPRSEFLTALITFNLGVEAGQLTVIAAAFLLVVHLQKSHERYRSLVVVPASCLIAATGLYWTVERLLA